MDHSGTHLEVHAICPAEPALVRVVYYQAPLFVVQLRHDAAQQSRYLGRRQPAFALTVAGVEQLAKLELRETIEYPDISKGETSESDSSTQTPCRPCHCLMPSPCHAITNEDRQSEYTQHQSASHQ